MEEKYIRYKWNGESFLVPESNSASIEKHYPDAEIEMHMDGETFNVPLQYKQGYLDKYGSKLSYFTNEDNTPKSSSVPSETTETGANTAVKKDDKDKTTVGESLGKGLLASALAPVRAALINLPQQLTAGMLYNDPITGEAKRLPDYDTQQKDDTNAFTRASKESRELNERLSREADPTENGEGFIDLILDGKFGKALQKGLATTAESSVTTLAARNPYTMFANMVFIASNNYAEQTQDNPNIPAWKRAAYAIGSAAWEQTVEKLSDPVFKYLGGGKAADITEEVAKEFIENGAKDAVQNIAKRIFKGIGKAGKNLVKDAGGEGLEEVATNFGNDALGTALDAVDGDKDYGITAQWEQYKSQNPYADLWDFSVAKAKEYGDAFIGGAMSGGYMAGGAQALGGGIKSYSEFKGRNNLQKARQYGSSMNMVNLYDTDTNVNEDIANAVETFTNESGESDLSAEFIGGLSSEDAFLLSRNEDLTPEQRQAMYRLSIDKSIQEGLVGSLDERLESEITANKILIEKASQDGKLVSGQHNGRLVYVEGVVTNKDAVKLPDGKNGPVKIYDAVTGEQSIVNSKEITRAITNETETVTSNIDALIREDEAKRREVARTTMSPRAKTKAVLPYARKKILIDVGNGITEVFVEKISDKGEVMIKCKKGDLGGQSILTMDASTFYDSIYRDDDGNPVVTEVEQGAEEEVTEPTEEAPVAETTGEEDYRGYEGQILINGRLIDVTDTQQDNPSNTVNYTYVDENGNMRVGSTTIQEFGAAIKQAEEQTKIPAPEPAPVENPEPVVNEPTPTPEPAPEETTEETDWDALFEKDTVAFYDEVKKQFGDKAMDFLNMEIQATQNEISSLEKNMGKTTNERAKNFSKLANLRLKLGSLNEMAELLERQSNTVAETPTETPTETTTDAPTETPTETTTEVPTEPVNETPVETTMATPIEGTPVTEAPTEDVDGKSENGFEFNENNVCTNPEVISVPPVKKGWAVMNEVKLAEFNGKWGSAIDAHTGTGGVGIPLTKSDCKFDTKEEAIADAYNALVMYRASRNGDTGLKDLDNLIKHLEKEYPFVKEAATTTPAPTTPAPAHTEPASVEPSDAVLDNGYIVMDGKIVNPDVIEMPDNKNKIYFAEKDGKWGYGYHAVTDDNNESWNDTIQLEMLRYDSKEDAIKGALSYFNTYKDIKKNSPSTGIDAFLDYVRNTYFPNEVPTAEPTVTPEPQPAPAPKPATPKPKPIGQVEQQSGNAIKRLFEEFKANAAKIAKKIGMKDFVDTDKTRPVMTGVHREGGFEYATDSRILAKIQTKYPSEQEGKTFSLKTGEEISGKYPKVSDIVESHMKNARLVSANVDDILAYSQLLEEIKKGLSNTNLYVKVGDKIFKSDILLKAAKMAKLHGLSDIYMRDDSRAPIIFVGSKGAVIEMPYQLNAGDQNVLDIDTGEIIFSDYTMLKSPTTLKGIEAARLALEAILPNISSGFIKNAKHGGWLRLVDGNVKFDFPRNEINEAKNKAKDPNTYNALDDIANNGLEIPLSDEEIAKIFPELVNDSQVNSVSLPNVSQAIESGVWNKEALNELNNIVKDVEEGKAILKRYTSSELTGLLEGGSLLVGASIISRGSKENVSSSRGRTASLEEKAAKTIPAIESWAKEIGVWRDYSERSEEEIAHSYWTSGGEAQVFYLGNGKVEKIIGLDYFVDPQLAIDRIAIHNSLFEETQLKVTGFGTNKDGKFAIIVEQPTIIGKHTDNAEIDSYIKSIGFEKIDDATRTFANEELYLSDLHEENVLNQEHKRYYVIDGDFRLNTPEAGIGGTREVDDSIARTEDDGILSRSGDVTPEDIRNEKAAIKEKAVADGTFMKAPNGEPTNLTEDQWLTVRTESFKNWFGDWENDPKNASKVVDKNGEPQVVYHGSPYGAITEFDRRGHSVSGLREFGTYFSTSKELAQLYAYARQHARGDIEKYETEKYRLDAIIFNNETPARVALDAFDELDRLEESQKPKVYEVFLNIREPKVFDAERSNGWDGWHKLKQDVGYDIKSGVEAIEAIAGHNSAARMDKKYDGIIAQNMADVHSEATEDLMGDVFLVFDETPANIKSATSNIGTFDSENQDIRYRRSTPVEFHQLEVDNFLSKYNPDCEVTVYPVNEKTAKMFGYTLEQLKNRHGRYLPSYDFIAIFAREDITDGQEIEETLFHESIHKLVQFSANEYMVSAGKWMFDNASTEEILSDYKKKIEENYADRSEVVKHEEMLAHVLSGAMRHGGTEALMSIVPSDSKRIINEILNAIRYESKAESERRIRETLSQSSVAEDVSESGSENAGQSSRRGYAGATGRPANAESGRRVTVENQNAAVNLHTGDTRDGIIERAVSEEAQKLGVNVTFAKRSEMAKGHETDKGYYNTKTGEIVICPENNASIADAIQTILHEAVAHKGLRQLMGDKFDEFISRVYDSLDDETKAKVDKLAEDHYKGNKTVAMEEYMATLAESEDFNDKSLWDKIVEIFEDIINKVLDRNDFTIGDNELRYILRASYANMVNPRHMDTIKGWAQEQMMREEYKINKAAPEILSRTGIDPTEVSRETARTTYDKVVSDNWQEFQRQFQDAMQPVRIAIDAIQQETGNIPIEDYENYILIQNHASSRSRIEIDEFERRYFGPIVDKVNEVVTAYIKATGGSVDNEAQRAAVYKMIKNYLIAKHGLERNQYYQLTKKRKLTPYEKKKEIAKLTEEYEAKVNDINANDTLSDTEKELEIRKATDELNASITEVKERLVPDLRDYSGLTALFGYPPKQYKKAEEEAKAYVANIEKTLGRVDDEDGNVVTESPILTDMWNKIKSATDKTLRHSYECGLLSRSQYDEIKDMFAYYIPLRGFDETTAEDVYSYSRFDGNRFNPAVQTVKGRTSLAEDPLAIIMNMAESEIAQGNKNRAKQALYNYLLNRSAGNKDQNSLMQIESVWYLVNYDDAGNEYFTIAAPNHEKGETYEEFEEKMLALEEEKKAFKSKKGKVDVGMRFQKQMDRNSHYVYLKVNGVEKAIYINGNPKAADAINGTYYPKSNAVVDKVKDINRFISSTFTNYSLSFTARNFIRDAIYSRINMSIRESDPAYRKKFRQNYWHAFGKMRKLIKAYRKGELDGRALTPDEAAFVEFMRNGGQTGYTVINSVENHKKELERAIKRMQRGTYNGGGKSGFMVMFKWIELMNESSELLTRFVAYKTSRDMGRGIETSIGNAKEITVNFNTRGAQDGTGILGGVARYFGWSKYFFNASVQGVQNLKSMAESNKIKFCATVGGMIGFGFAMPLIHALATLWGDDDENEYWNIPEYDRQNNICIQVFGTYIKIPLPIGFREMYAIGDTMAAALCDKKFSRDLSQIGMDMANKVASIVLPINPLESAANGLGLWQTGAYAILPSGTQFAIQNMTNIDWKGAPLQKEYTYNEHDPQWTKAFASNPKWMTGLSKWCNENINLDGDFDGMDWSPEKLDNTLSNVFGGMYSLVKQFGRTVSTALSEDKDFNMMSVPLVGVVLSSGIDDDDRFVTDIYYDMKEYYDKNVNSIKRTAKTFGYDLKEVFNGKNVGAHHPKMQRIYSNSNFDFMQEWYIGNKELESLKNKIEYRENKIAGMDKVPNELIDEIADLKNKLENERREFVNDMLELD